jgi:hypothetical protein
MAYQNEIGLKITLKVGIDISTASVLRIYYLKPNGENSYWTASQEATTEISYTTIAGDLNCPGTFKLQAYVKIGTAEYYGNITRLSVSSTLAGG